MLLALAMSLALMACGKTKEFTVSFSGAEVATQTVLKDECAVRPAVAPNKVGYDFVGWYEDEALTKEFDFSKPIQKDTTVYAKFNIKTYVSSVRNEVVQPHLHSFVTNGWGADYGDPQNYLGQEVYGNDNAYYSANYSYINEITEETPENKALLDTYKEYSAMVEAADAITDDLDARYAAYAKAEAYLLDHVLVLPCNYSIGWCLSKIDNDTKMYAMYGAQNEKIKNWATNSAGYTSEEKGVAEQIKAFTESK